MPDDNLALVVDLKSEVLLLLFRSNSSKKSRTTGKPWSFIDW